MKQIVFVCVCLGVAGSASADTLVTWQADGQINTSHAASNSYTAAPPGTPLSVTLMFNPSQASPTINGSNPGCMSVPVSASVSIGGGSYTATGIGFTHAYLPGTNCGSSGGFTQFSLHNLQQPANSPWSPLFGGVLIFDYRDLLNQDGFPVSPNVPPGINAGLFYTPVALSEFASWTFSGGLAFQAVEQQTPVPGPATLSLLGIGLAATAWRRRRSS